MIYLNTPCECFDFETSNAYPHVREINIDTHGYNLHVRASASGPRLAETSPNGRQPDFSQEIYLAELDIKLSAALFFPQDEDFFLLNPKAIVRLANMLAYINAGAWHLAALHIINCPCHNCPRLKKLFQEIVPREKRETLWASTILNSEDIRKNGTIIDHLFLDAPIRDRETKAGEQIRKSEFFCTSIQDTSGGKERVDIKQAWDSGLIQPGEPIRLIPDNYEEPQKISAYTADMKIGDLPLELSRAISPLIQAGEHFSGRINRVLSSWRSPDDRIAISVHRV
ncbi:MAG: hypothetical protein ACQES5_08790 [Thermodesulfobacteriota bacterium]